MKSSRLKNIVIVILLLVNAFLLFLLLSRRAEQRAAYDRSVDQLVTLYETSGVSLDPAILALNGTLLSAALDRDAAQEAAFAEALLGSADMSDSGGGVCLYSGEYGLCSIRANGAVEASLSRPVDDPEAFSHNLFEAFGYECTHTQLSDGGGSISGVRSASAHPVFNASLTLSFSGGNLTAVSGIFLSALTEGRRTDGIDAVTALVRFLDYRSTSGIVCTQVLAVDGGYLLQSSATVPLRLLPVWRITTDVNIFYVNCKTGEITRE